MYRKFDILLPLKLFFIGILFSTYLQGRHAIDVMCIERKDVCECLTHFYIICQGIPTKIVVQRMEGGNLLAQGQGSKMNRTGSPTQNGWRHCYPWAPMLHRTLIAMREVYILAINYCFSAWCTRSKYCEYRFALIVWPVVSGT